MRLLFLSAEAAAAATTRQPCETCGGKGWEPVVASFNRYGEPDAWSADPSCPDCRMLLRFVPVADTYTEGEHIQIAATCATCEGAGWDWKRWADEDIRVDDPVDHYWCVDCGNGYRVVATATVARVLPIVDDRVDHDTTAPHICVGFERVCSYPGTVEADYGDDIFDHLPFVTFTPGGTAIELADIQPC